MAFNPCIRCGACCACFRASFYWGEADDVTPGGVPVALTDDLNHYVRAMKGTNRGDPWCIALEGVIGESVACSIYERRATVCRSFIPSYENGEQNPRCDQARARHGMPPLTPQDWEQDRPTPEPENPDHPPSDLPTAA